MTELESCGGCRHGVYEPAAPNHRVSSPLCVQAHDILDDNLIQLLCLLTTADSDEELVLPVVPASAEEPRRGAE